MLHKQCIYNNNVLDQVKRSSGASSAPPSPVDHNSGKNDARDKDTQLKESPKTPRAPNVDHKNSVVVVVVADNEEANK